jgi:hypothetical protein
VTRPGTPGKPVGSGRHADVYDIGGGRVVKRYRVAGAPVERESQVMIHARAHGVPVPRVFDVSGTDIVMEMASGPTMIGMLTRRPWTVWYQARLLVQLHDQVHRVPALDWLRTPFGPGNTLLHTDIHPSNVILTADGARLIDWQGAAQGPAPADIAMTWVLISTGNAPASTRLMTMGRAGREVFIRCFLVAAGRVEAHWAEAAIAYRLADPTATEVELRRLRRLIGRTAPPPWQGQ